MPANDRGSRGDGRLKDCQGEVFWYKRGATDIGYKSMKDGAYHGQSHWCGYWLNIRPNVDTGTRGQWLCEYHAREEGLIW